MCSFLLCVAYLSPWRLLSARRCSAPSLYVRLLPRLHLVHSFISQSTVFSYMCSILCPPSISHVCSPTFCAWLDSPSSGCTAHNHPRLTWLHRNCVYTPLSFRPSLPFHAAVHTTASVLRTHIPPHAVHIFPTRADNVRACSYPTTHSTCIQVNCFNASNSSFFLFHFQSRASLPA